MDPREIEMISIVNMQEVPEEIKKEIQDIESGVKLPPSELKKLQKIENETVKEQEEEDSDEILQPGKKIKPEITEAEATKLAERLYGIVAKDITELISYDDRNFLIHSDRNIKNPIIPNYWEPGYVLKIHNTLDSKKKQFIDGQTQLMLFLSQQNIKCTKPVMNIFGKNFSTEKLGDSTHVVRLLEYQPGQIFASVPKTNNMYYQVGEFVARFDNAVKHFEHDAYKRHKTLWQLDLVPKLNDFLSAVKDEEKRGVVEEVLAAFDKKVLANIDTFAKGIIHGDFNEQNILVNETSKGGEYKVSGIIDFGDTSCSYYVFELAIAMAYMIMQSKEISTGGLVIAGYSMARNIPEHERKVLKVCVAARLCQSLVLGAYSHQLDPDNSYVLTTQAAGWDMLLRLWAEPDDKIEELWVKTADNYLTQSTK
ncbi:Hydroxylysine kinase [Pseudolycoriella hygida]|uniref:Hydroxylysine kinase n=1 Tax=Pseudolycoriella hygida TaxID=35572 RepID=A0A9Q0NA03_9DIPT|nr:Hydroxylysine kinase [Pseudolycoriella hygida]